MGGRAITDALNRRLRCRGIDARDRLEHTRRYALAASRRTPVASSIFLSDQSSRLENQHLLLFLFAQDVGHPGGTMRPSASSTSWRPNSSGRLGGVHHWPVLGVHGGSRYSGALLDVQSAHAPRADSFSALHRRVPVQPRPVFAARTAGGDQRVSLRGL